MQEKNYGATSWMIPDCFYPSVSSPGIYVSHESICVLNCGAVDAQVQITLYFEDREPLAGFTAPCSACRTHHIRMDRLVSQDGHRVPQDIPYAALVESNVPIVVQYSRMDTSQAEIGLATTLAFPV